MYCASLCFIPFTPIWRNFLCLTELLSYHHCPPTLYNCLGEGRGIRCEGVLRVRTAAPGSVHRGASQVLLGLIINTIYNSFQNSFLLIEIISDCPCTFSLTYHLTSWSLHITISLNLQFPSTQGTRNVSCTVALRASETSGFPLFSMQLTLCPSRYCISLTTSALGIFSSQLRL